MTIIQTRDPSPNGDKPDEPWSPPGEPTPSGPDPWVPAPKVS